MKKRNTIELSKIIGVGILVLICIFISCLGHFILQSHLFYIPIILGSLWWGYKSLIIPVILGLSLLITHFLGVPESFLLVDILKMCMFFFVGTLISFINQKRIALLKQQKALGKSLFNEIEDRKQIEQALLDSAQYWQSTFDAQHEFILLVDLEGAIIKCNNASLKYFKIKSNDILGKKFEELLPYTPEIPKECLIKTVLKTQKRESAERQFDNKWLKITVDPIIKENELKHLVVIITDISEIKNNILNLGKSESKYKDIVELANIAVARDNKNGNLIYFNKQFAELFGYTSKEILKLTHNDLVHPDDIDWVSSIHKKRFANIKSIAQYEFKGLKKNGDTIYIDISVSDIIKSNNEVTGTISYLRDITERKKTEEKIKRLAHTIESIRENVSITDINNKIIYVNKSLLNKYGYTEKELIGKTPDILRADKENGLTNNIFLNTKKDQWTGEVWNKKKDGTVFPIELTTSKIMNEKGKVIALVGIGRDITERKLSEKLKKIIFDISQFSANTNDVEEFVSIIKTHLQEIIDTTNFYIAFYNKQTDTFNSPFFADKKDSFTSWPAGKSLSAWVVKNEKPLLITKDEIYKMAEAGEVDLVGTTSENWLGVPLRIKGEVYGLFAVQSYEKKDTYNSNDMEVLMYISDQLSRLIERKKYVEELEITLQKAKQSDKLKSAFLANMSHEIRTPMNGIQGFVNLLKKPDLTGEKKELFINLIQKSSERMLNIINDIVNLSKIESGMTEVNNSNTNINSQIENIYDFFNSEAEEKGLKLFFHKGFETKKAELITDEKKLRTILGNLVKNAIKFTLEGSINFGYVKRGAFLEFFVKDTGVGISPDKLELIFERFMQADISESRAYEGAGLGLSITKAYVEMLGGKIWVESNKEKLPNGQVGGSVFYFTLPYHVAEKQEINSGDFESLNTEDKHIKNLKILIAEDDKTSKILLTEFTEIHGNKILCAINGKEAVDICRNDNTIDLVLMDVKMPILNGYEATKQIRQFNKDVVIIAQTAFVITGDKKKALEAGCNDYITKPISIERLKSIFNTYF
jgi:PAS domain S-box-containing protein